MARTARLALPAAPVTAGTGLLVLLHRLAWSAGQGLADGTRLKAPGCVDEASCDVAYARLHAVTALLTVAAFLLLRRRTATARTRREATA
ncbi:hypothetical protein [Streptomyces sp. HUAS TT20]|uniref:hypothetical protein n=1 Tax=Streptomyces sp. HUAS TT20 TaxID=3447509 RepID=UPI0021D7E51D|nr:hypothetical protein [Streptomyces sp. HUAS 15-9]UXY28436.1 hypothetical protein N8I87_18860 [Streptomyces sp. HUAS 15-9]